MCVEAGARLPSIGFEITVGAPDCSVAALTFLGRPLCRSGLVASVDAKGGLGGIGSDGADVASSAVRASGNAPCAILTANAEIAAGLDLDQLQNVAGVFQTVHCAHRDVDRFVLMHGLDDVILRCCRRFEAAATADKSSARRYRLSPRNRRLFSPPHWAPSRNRYPCFKAQRSPPKTALQAMQTPVKS
jgi:hypothetical protein